MSRKRYEAWIEWTRTRLSHPEAELELEALGPGELARLHETGWVWIPGCVLWRDPTNALRRTRFTHGAYIQTAKGAFFVDSVGGIRRLPEDLASA